MKKAKVHLNNGEVAHMTIYLDEVESWINTVADRGIRTEDSYFPYHSIVYIIFEDEVSEAEGNGAGVVAIMKEAD